jgi:dienelactone hydrolase
MACLLVVALLLIPGVASAAEKIDVSVRGKTLTLTLYRPAGGAPPRGTILMGSGDAGWVGLGVAMSEELSEQGYLVAGINVRQYLSSFTSGRSHVETGDVPGDYRVFRDTLIQKGALARPVVLSGMSEGAALAVLAAADAKNHDWVDGVITMGLPPSAELAWRWTDVSSLILKRDANEPSFAPKDMIAGVAPLPLYMIQSAKDEYVPKAEYERLSATAREPKRLVVIDASNHRFTDKRAELTAAYTAGLQWIVRASPRGKPR